MGKIVLFVVVFVNMRSFSNISLVNRRFFSTEASQDFVLSLATPQSSYFHNSAVKSVRVPAHTGAMVILSKHVPTIAQLKPGLVVVEPEEGEATKYFVSGGYAFIHPDNSCSVNAIECVPLADLDLGAAKEGLQKYEALSKDAANDEEKAVAMIGLDVHQEMIHALSNV